jgi:hypothetical protein
LIFKERAEKQVEGPASRGEGSWWLFILDRINRIYRIGTCLKGQALIIDI